jgi:hypothetical protein
MSTVDYTGSISDISNTIRDGIKAEFEHVILKKLHEVVDPIVSQTAKELAERTVLAVRSYTRQDVTSMSPQIFLELKFNNDKIKFTLDEPGFELHDGQYKPKEPTVKKATRGDWPGP